MMFDAPSTNALEQCGTAQVYDTHLGGESKLCLDAMPAWIAAQKDGYVIIEQMLPSSAEGTYPDDLEALARDTHKFEARYLDGLIGPYPEARDLYRERSPIHFTERLSCPAHRRTRRGAALSDTQDSSKELQL